MAASRLMPRLSLALGLALPLAAIAPDAAVVRAQQRGAESSAQPSAGDIAVAIEIVRKDPNLDTEMTVSTLRWKGPRSKPDNVDWPVFQWIRGFVEWLERSARFFIWVGVAILAVWLVSFIVRLARGRKGRDAASGEFVAPTHVRDLDIRPEALPCDIGAAARALWDRGEQRAALALLYRGLLSRLAHVHRVPIRDSSTEGDCLALAADHLRETSRRDYASRLIGIWQRAVYGRQDPSSSAVYELCDAFASALDRTLAPEGPGAGVSTESAPLSSRAGGGA